MAILSAQEIEKLEGQVIWPHAFVDTTLNRTRDLDTEFSRLYKRVFGTYFQPLEIRIPHLPMANETAQTDAGVDDMLAPQTNGLPLSIVVTTRNDNHSHRMQERTQSFIDNIWHLAEKTQTRVELVIVEWNPPADRPPLRDAFIFPADHSFLSVVIMTVGKETHDHYDMADVTPLYQMIAKNVGIRRARGAFILATNIDVLFSEKLFRAMTSKTLKSGHLYRSHRCDVNNDILDLTDPADILRVAEEKALRTHYQEGPLAPGAPRTPLTSLYDRFGADDLSWQRAGGKVKLRVAKEVYRVGWQSLPNLHYQQCGDFQLMHRDDWCAVRGYMELDGFIFHLDSLLAVTAKNADITEQVFQDDHLHYHIDHKMGIEVKPGIYESGSGKELTHLSIYELWAFERYMAAKGGVVTFNNHHWGCASADVSVEQITKTPWHVTEVTANAPTSSHGRFQKACLVSPDQVVGTNAQIYERITEQARSAQTVFARYIRQKYTGRAIWVWGTGGRGRYLHHILSKQKVEVSGFCTSADGSPNTLQCLPVEVGAAHLDPDNSLVIIASIFAEDIRIGLVEAGFEEGDSYLVGL